MQGSDRLASVRLLKQAAGRIWKYHNGFPVASIAPLSQNYFSLQSKVTFVGSAILPAGQTGSGTWIVKRRPTGSTATVQTNADGSGFLQPDVVGDYTIGYVVGGSTSRPDTDFVSFKSTANKPPVVDFTFPSSIKVGDVVALDGTATRDPDNDSLAYSWSTGPFYSDFWSSYDTLKNLTNDTKATATFAARKSGTYNITLTVKDSFATVMQTKQLTVVPQVIGTISQSGQHSVTLYPMAPNLGYYFSSRFVPQSNGLWALINGAPVQLDLSANLAVPVQAYSVFPGATFAIGNSFIVGLNMMVFLTDEKGDITSSYVLNQTLYSHYPFNLTGYPSTGDSLVTGLVYAAPYLYVTSGIDGVYRFNCSNPASIVSAGHFSDGNYWRNARLDGGNLLSYNPRTGKVLVLDISNPSSMTKVTEFSSPVFPSKFGSIYAGVSNDTMFVFSGSSGYPLILQSTVIAPKSINSYNKYSSLWSDGVSIVTGTYDGLCIYNAVPLTAPQLTHQYITGWYDPSVYLTGTRILFSGIRGGDDTFDGIHDLQFVPTGVERTENLTPSQYELFQNYPNPFNPTTVITYALPDAGQVTLKLYDMLGREMQSLVSEHQIAGTYRYVLDVASLSTGTYFYRLTAGSFVATQKMVILK